VFLACGGWSVTGVDILPDALERGRALAARYALDARRIAWQEIDLEHNPPDGWGPIDLAVMIRYLHRPLFARLKDWLAPGASVVVETFTATHRARHGRPARPAHVLEDGELRMLLDGWDLRHYSEAWRGKRHTARAWAVRAA
jgi:hypothetical protein